MPGSEMAKMMGLDKIEDSIAALKRWQQAVADNPNSEHKSDIKASIANAVETLSGTVALGTMTKMTEGIAPQESEPTKVETEAVKPVYNAVGKFIERKLNEDGQAAKEEDPVDVGLKEATKKILTDKLSGNDSDPLHKAAAEAMADILKERLHPQPKEDDPITAAAKEVFKERAHEWMNPHYPTLAEQVRELQENQGAIHALFPQPTPSMSDKVAELEMKKIEMQERVERYKIDKELEAQARKAASWEKIADTLSGAAGAIGAGVADRLMAPAAMKTADAPSAIRPIKCPACGQDAVPLTRSMIAQLEQGQDVQAVCAGCGQQHTLEGKAGR